MLFPVRGIWSKGKKKTKAKEKNGNNVYRLYPDRVVLCEFYWMNEQQQQQWQRQYNNNENNKYKVNCAFILSSSFKVFIISYACKYLRVCVCCRQNSNVFLYHMHTLINILMISINFPYMGFYLQMNRQQWQKKIKWIERTIHTINNKNDDDDEWIFIFIIYDYHISFRIVFHLPSHFRIWSFVFSSFLCLFCVRINGHVTDGKNKIACQSKKKNW